jgi:hypothetical protein
LNKENVYVRRCGKLRGQNGAPLLEKVSAIDQLIQPRWQTTKYNLLFFVHFLACLCDYLSGKYNKRKERM